MVNRFESDHNGELKCLDLCNINECCRVLRRCPVSRRACVYFSCFLLSDFEIPMMVEDPIDEITLNDSVSEGSEAEQVVDVENHESPTPQTVLISVHSAESSVDLFRKKCQERRLREDELKRAVDTYRGLVF